MPGHTDKKKPARKQNKGKMDKMTKQEHDMFKKAVKDGILTQKQHDNLPTPLLKAIVNKKSKK